jgi:hypothetical protein
VGAGKKGGWRDRRDPEKLEQHAVPAKPDKPTDKVPDKATKAPPDKATETPPAELTPQEIETLQTDSGED